MSKTYGYPSTKKVVLFTHPDCEACPEAEAAGQEASQTLGVPFEKVDLAQEPGRCPDAFKSKDGVMYVPITCVVDAERPLFDQETCIVGAMGRLAQKLEEMGRRQ